MIERRKFIQGLTAAALLHHLPGMALSQFSSPADCVNSLDDDPGFGTRIKVMGVGNVGCHAVEYMIECGVRGAEFVNANAYAQYLRCSAAHRTIHLSDVNASVNQPPKDCFLAEAAIDAVRAAIDGTHMLLIMSGTGQTSDGSAAPVIARIAREMGILTVGIVTEPYGFADASHRALVIGGIVEFEASVDSLLLLVNNNFLKIPDSVLIEDVALQQSNDVAKNLINDLAGVINLPQPVGFDYGDVVTILSQSGITMIGMATVGGPDRARRAAEQAVANAVLEGVSLAGAQGVLVLVAASPGTVKLSESFLAMNTIRAHVSPDAHIVYGTADDNSLGSQIRVTVIATAAAGPRASTGFL